MLDWVYQCSICGKLVTVDDVSSHTNEEREKPDWPGWMRMERVDLQSRVRIGSGDHAGKVGYLSGVEGDTCYVSVDAGPAVQCDRVEVV